MPQTPDALLEQLLASDLEVRSSFQQATHDHALARATGRAVDELLDAHRRARDALENEQRRLDPRRTRRFDFRAGTALVATALVAVAASLDLQLKPAHIVGLPLAAAAGAAGAVGVASYAGVAHREANTKAFRLATIGLLAATLLTAELHINAARHARQPEWEAVGVAALLTLVIAAILVLTAVIAARLEPLSVARLRARARQARREHEHTLAQLRADRERANTERERFLNLLRIALADHPNHPDQHTSEETLTLAASLITQTPTTPSDQQH